MRTARSLLVPASLLLASLAGAQTPVAKDVATGPQDVLAGRVRLPDPAALAVRSRSALRRVRFAPGAGAPVAELVLPHPGGPATLVVLSPELARWRVELVAADDSASALDALPAVEGPVEPDASAWSARRWDLAALPAGSLRLRVHAPGDRPPAEGELMLADAGPTVESRLSTLERTSDGPIGVLVRAITPGAVLAAGSVEVTSGRGVERLDLFDDGRHFDGGDGDGVLGAWLPEGLSGHVVARVDIDGRDARGARFARTLRHAFPVLEPDLVLDGTVATRVLDERRLALELGAWSPGTRARALVAAEVWGDDGSGREVPVCWLARMVELDPRSSDQALELRLDARWLGLAGARPPLVLREVRVQDPETSGVLQHLARLDVPEGPLPVERTAPAGAPTPSMLEGVHAQDSTPTGPLAERGAVTTSGALMLVHGYCSGGSIWPPADFDPPKVEFLDPDQNRTNDQFAQLIAARGAALGSFGVVAHSQGGLAALHLYTYYTSGLDRASGPRRIQSVASPYQGTPLASLGAFACGVNDDMTPSGAATWLAGIPTWARDDVYYWTTADDGTACNFLTDLFLSDPNDGTVERARGQLPGGNSMGHVIGWCHTTGMSDPANYTDHARNAQMDAQAAR